MSFISVSNVSKSYAKTQVLKNINLTIEKGTQTVIKGASGSGKSTLLYLLGGLEKMDTGAINVAGKNISKLNDVELANYRNSEVGFIFQFHFLLSSLTCLENILLPARIGNKNLEETKKYINHLATRLGVLECLEKYPYEISGGQQQRINFIRALSLKPKILLCDEPTGNLDSVNSKMAAELLLEISRSNSTTLIIVTHDDSVASIFERVVFMQDGQLHQMPHVV